MVIFPCFLILPFDAVLTCTEVSFPNFLLKLHSYNFLSFKRNGSQVVPYTVTVCPYFLDLLWPVGLSIMIIRKVISCSFFLVPSNVNIKSVLTAVYFSAWVLVYLVNPGLFSWHGIHWLRFYMIYLIIPRQRPSIFFPGCFSSYIGIIYS